MNQRNLVKRLTIENGGKIMITQNKAAQLLGMGRESFAEMMQGWSYYPGGKGGAKNYLVDDVASAYLLGVRK
jgi:hypothetical protein